MIDPETVLAIATAPKRNSRHWNQTEITWGGILTWVKSPADVKESGDYLLGTLRPTAVQHKKGEDPCTNIHRRKDAIVSRSALALDVDHPKPGFVEKLEMLGDYAALIHTTYSSSPDDLRYRVLIPTNREMSPDEYIAVATAIMRKLGEDQFDPGTTQPERYMFRPAAQEPQWFESWVMDGDPADVDRLLEEHAEFKDDLSSEPMPILMKSKRDPFDMEGVIGAFNRAYEDIQLLIEEYELPYEPAGEDRWHMVGARSVAGMGIVTPGIVYSHHANDPAFGQACTAFDLVRLHRFEGQDEKVPSNTPINRLPSHKMMLVLASKDPRAISELVGLDFDVVDDDNDWKLLLRRSARTGKLIDDIGNWDTIIANDPVFRGIYFNELTMSIETEKDLPWRKLEHGGAILTRMDRSSFSNYIEREYRFRPAGASLDVALDDTATKRFVNPIQNYLDSLVWDRVKRVETCLPGVTPTSYTRLAARKSLVAAVARVFEPGCKWDHTLVLFGNEGLGKSFWIDRMSRGYSASLGRIGDKDTLITMQRSWIMISDEGHSLRKADADASKEFLTRRADVFRMPYERDAQSHKRHCVIWGTTNDATFLRRQEGNRRFLIVHCEERVDFEKFSDEYVDQLWAEAVYLYQAGELLFLDIQESDLASEERESFVEEDALGGVIYEFLNTLVPDDWSEMTPDQRRVWVINREDNIVPVGTHRIMETCSAQMWVEAMGRKFGEHKRTDLLEITKSLRQIGWKATPGHHRLAGYGPQVVFVRDDLGGLL